jgi:hypothetical protein
MAHELDFSKGKAAIAYAIVVTEGKTNPSGTFGKSFSR